MSGVDYVSAEEQLSRKTRNWFAEIQRKGPKENVCSNSGRESNCILNSNFKTVRSFQIGAGMMSPYSQNTAGAGLLLEMF
jgi:hypothetical protein